MPKNEQDPAASTQQFRAFAGRGEPQRQRSNVWLVAGVVIAVVVVVVVAVNVLV